MAKKKCVGTHRGDKGNKPLRAPNGDRLVWDGKSDHLDKIRKKRRRRNARKGVRRESTFNRFHGLCADCKKDVSDYWEVHHDVPISDGGNNEPKNLVLLCQKCHDTRHGRIRKTREVLSR